MPRCKYCGENITKFDKKLCPYCGKENPIDENVHLTSHITQTIATVEKEEIAEYKDHKKKTYVLLSCFLGIFGVHEFYLGLIKRGFLNLGIALISICAIGTLLFFFSPLKLFSYLVAFGAIYLIYLIKGIFEISNKTKVDSKGIPLR